MIRMMVDLYKSFLMYHFIFILFISVFCGLLVFIVILSYIVTIRLSRGEETTHIYLKETCETPAMSRCL